MRVSIAKTISPSLPAALIGAWIAATAATAPARANVITDWDEKAAAVVSSMPPYRGERVMGMVHVAMFDAVNSIDRRYRHYLVQLPTDGAASTEAAAAAAAAAILAAIDPKTAGEIKLATATYLVSIPNGRPKSDGVEFGEAVAAKVLEARANDGADMRPRTTHGVYVPTPIAAASMWPNVKPFAMAKPSQFRPNPPVSLESKEWAADFNELKDMVERRVRSGQPRRPRPPDSGSWTVRRPFMRLYASS